MTAFFALLLAIGCVGFFLLVLASLAGIIYQAMRAREWDFVLMILLLLCVGVGGMGLILTQPTR